MKTYQEMSKEELTQELTALKAEYEKIKGMGLALDMSRGKPGADQLDLSMGMLDVLDSKTALKSENGTDLRNYGVLDGIPEAKKLMADVIGTKPENVIVYGNKVVSEAPLPTTDAPVAFDPTLLKWNNGYLVRLNSRVWLKT